MYFQHFLLITGIAFGNGNVWRIQRRFTLATFRNFGMGKSKFEDKIAEESQFLMEEFANHMHEQFDPAHVLKNAISNVTCSVIFGKRFQYSDQEFKKALNIIDRQLKLLGTVGLLISVPIIRLLLFRQTTLQTYMQEIRQYIGGIIREHKIKFDSNNVKDYIDVYLKELQEGGFTGVLNENSLLLTVVQLFVAGTDTTVNTLKWGLLYMMKYPEVQAKVQQEIDEEIGCSRLPNMSDNLPYTVATLMEIQRIATIVPLGTVFVCLFVS